MVSVMNSERIGTVVREERTRRKLKQRDLAARMGVTQALVSQLEKGQIGWSVDRLVAVATTLGMTPEAILSMARNVPEQGAAA